MTILVLDIGSSSVRAMLFDEYARPIPGAEARLAHQLTTVPAGASVIDAESLCLNLEQVIGTLLSHPAARHIQAVAMDTFVGNILGVDADGRPLTPVFTYADTRCAEDIEYLRQHVNLHDSHQRTGCVLHTAYLPGRLHWLRRTHPSLFAAVYEWVDFGTYVYRRWFAHTDVPCSYSVAAWTGLLNRQTLAWDETWLRILEIPVHTLSGLSDYDTHTYTLSNDYANKWPELEGVPFLLAIGDGAAANVGSGCLTPERLALTIGTTAAIRVASTLYPDPVPAGLWSYRITAKTHLTGGATSEGGNIFAWAREVLNLTDLRDLDKTLANRPADAHGLTFLPLLAGERSPGWQAQATGTVHGLRLSTSALDIVQAALEGVALRLSIIADQLSPFMDAETDVIAGGGAVQNSNVWTQMIANALNRPIHVTDDAEVTARGTALLALRALDLPLPDLTPSIAHVLRPQPDQVERLHHARQRQSALYQNLYVSRHEM
ncbi:MAG: gluconokinase [Anaerolineae bacterium]